MTYDQSATGQFPDAANLISFNVSTPMDEPRSRDIRSARRRSRFLCQSHTQVPLETIRSSLGKPPGLQICVAECGDAHRRDLLQAVKILGRGHASRAGPSLTPSTGTQLMLFSMPNLEKSRFLYSTMRLPRGWGIVDMMLIDSRQQETSAMLPCIRSR